SSTATEVAGIESTVGRCRAELAAQHVADLPQQLRQIDIGPVAVSTARVGISMEVRGIVCVGVLVSVQCIHPAVRTCCGGACGRGGEVVIVIVGVIVVSHVISLVVI